MAISGKNKTERNSNFIDQHYEVTPRHAAAYSAYPLFELRSPAEGSEV